MGLVRDLAKRVVKGVAARVGKDDLFEKPGERAPSPPLKAAAPAVSPPLPPGRAGEGKAAAPAPAVSPPLPPGEGAPRASEGKAPAPAPAPAPAALAAPAPAPATPVTPSRPAEGCIPVDLDGLRAALAPAGKPLVVNHWATWCDPCVDELPRLVRAAAGVADIGEFIGVSWDLFDHPGKPAVVAKKVGQFADNAGVGYGSVLFTGTPEQLFTLCNLGFEQIPQTLVIAPDGRVVYHKKGVIDHDDVFPLINAVKAARS